MALHTEAGKAWAAGGLLTQAASRLPPDHLQGVLLQLVSCLVQQVSVSAALLNDALPVAVIKAGGQVEWQHGDIAGARASIRTCAHHAQQLVLSLASQPQAQQQLVGVLLQLLAPDCRVWTAGVPSSKEGSNIAGVGAGGLSGYMGPGVFSATGLAVVAQLMQLVGPGLVLETKSAAAEDDSDSDNDSAQAGDGDDVDRGPAELQSSSQQQQQPQARAWVLAELVCCQLAVAEEVGRSTSDDDGEDEDPVLHPAYKQVLPLLKASPQSPIIRKALAAQGGLGLLNRGRTAPVPVSDVALCTCISSLANPTSSALLREVVHLLAHGAGAGVPGTAVIEGCSIQLQALRHVLSQVAAAATTTTTSSSSSPLAGSSASCLSPATKLLESVCATHLLPLGTPQALTSLPSAPASTTVLLELLPIVAPPLRAPGRS
jgi:hypothetical protein